MGHGGFPPEPCRTLPGGSALPFCCQPPEGLAAHLLTTGHLVGKDASCSADFDGVAPLREQRAWLPLSPQPACSGASSGLCSLSQVLEDWDDVRTVALFILPHQEGKSQGVVKPGIISIVRGWWHRCCMG